MSEKLTFDGFTIDPAELSLTYKGARLDISLSALRLLLALLERPGEMVTKDQLMTRVWGSSPVSENALHVQISALRKIVGGTCIQTKSGVGYRFAGRIEKRGAGRHAGLPESAARAASKAVTPGLIGREKLLRDIEDLLDRRRLVTLTGAGGVGKTSLARAMVQAANLLRDDGERAGEVWFADLADATDAEGVQRAVAGALGMDHGGDRARLQAWARQKTGLLVLDSCDRAPHAAARLLELLSGCAPGLRILATSRQELGAAGETVVSVPPLAVPQAGVGTWTEARRSPAFQLFMARVATLQPAVRPNRDEVAAAVRICRALGGLPLAIDMAAGWAGAVGFETLETKLTDAPLAMLCARVAAQGRHVDLRSMLNWSHDLLPPAERMVLRRLAVFSQAFTIAAAETMSACEAVPEPAVFPCLAHLVQAHFIVPVTAEGQRIYRLTPITRAFALEKLREAGEETCLRNRHARHLLAVLAAAEIEWDTRSTADWLADYGALVPDLHGALDWTIGGGGETDTGIALAAAAWPLWRELSLRQEGAQRLEAARALVHAATPPATVAQLHFGIAMMYNDSHRDLARIGFAEAARLYRQFGERQREGRALQHLAFTMFALGHPKDAEHIADSAHRLLEGQGSQRALAAVYAVRLVLLANRQEYGAAREAGYQAVRLYESMDAERSALSTRSNMIDVALCAGDVQTAIEESRSLAARLRGTPHTVLRRTVQRNLVAALVRANHCEDALEAAREAAEGLAPNDGFLIGLLDHLALRNALIGRANDAAVLAGYTECAYRGRGWPRQPVEQTASDCLRDVLVRALPGDAMARSMRDGAMLSEMGACAIAALQVSRGPNAPSRGRPRAGARG